MDGFAEDVDLYGQSVLEVEFSTTNFGHRYFGHSQGRKQGGNKKSLS